MFTEDSESYQEQDFSTASEWETFIARLEEIILGWKLHLEKIGPPLKSNELSTGDWEIKTETATFAGKIISILTLVSHTSSLYSY